MKITKIEYTPSQIEFTIDTQTILGDIKVNYWRDTGEIRKSSFNSEKHESIISDWILGITKTIRGLSDYDLDQLQNNL